MVKRAGGGQPAGAAGLKTRAPIDQAKPAVTGKAVTDKAAARPSASMFFSEVAVIPSAPPATSDESSTCAWTSLSTVLVATDTAAGWFHPG